MSSMLSTLARFLHLLYFILTRDRLNMSLLCVCRLAEVKAKSLRYLEIKDGRISRLHCMITADYPVGSSWLSTTSSIATIEDLSSNGTFVNGKRLSKGERVNLHDGDKISLVMSLSPMVERAVIFRAG